MIHLHIEHRTHYQYEKPVSFSPHLVRLFPRMEPGRLVRAIELVTNPGAYVRYGRDLFDNSIARCNYPELSDELAFNFTAELAISERNAFDFLLDRYAVDFPFSYQSREAASLIPYIAREDADASRLLPLPFWQAPASRESTISILVDLTSAVHRNIAYERRDTGAARQPAETVALGTGACRDTAVLLAAILRELGLAARLVSGYLCEFETAQSDRVAEHAMHAWTEVYLPGAGWLGLDPTNGVLANHNHIATAVGLTPADIEAIPGHYYGDVIVGDKMTADIRLSIV